MGDKTKIQWADASWNPVTGCDHVSPGCDRCYAEKLAEQWSGTKQYPNGFRITLWPERLDLPIRWKKPRKVFVNSMSDLFHKGIPVEYVDQIWDVMLRSPRHIFQVLTKRSSRMARYVREAETAPHIWLGVSVEDEKRKVRIAHLRETPTIGVRFLSCEPLLGPLALTPEELDGIGWVIVGGESGPEARRMDPDWAREIRDCCEAAGVPFFMKQMGSYGRQGKGGDLDAIPTDLQRRAYPPIPGQQESLFGAG